MTRIFVALLVLAAVSTAGCGSSGSAAKTTTAGRSGAPATASAPVNGPSSNPAANPNAPEVSPAGDIPDTQVYVRFRPPDGLYAIKFPEGWSRSSSGGAIVFSASVNSMRVESLPASRPPTPASATATEVPRLAANPGFKLQSVTQVSRPAGTAVRIAYLANSAANSVTGKTIVLAVERYEFFHRGHELVVTLSSPKGADNVDPWKAITGSVRFPA